ncbi:hypothetical protein [Paenibacillus sp. NRS-1760]|uniref:hypothetical protein n=1 Tax=Paenibacillus sp. NRS-1760 TaxID=3233902 RepID=UPI003D2C1DD3
MVLGSLSIEFPEESKIQRKHFWSVDVHDNMRAGHGWLFVPPYYVVDLTIKQQGTSKARKNIFLALIMGS